MDAENSEDELTPAVSQEVLETMADPFRQRAYDTLLVFGDMTARKVAKLTNISEASLNRHMQQLEGIGFVRSINPEAPVRQRIWHAIRGGVRVGDFTENEDYAPAIRAWSRAQIEAQTHVLQDWIDVSKTWPIEFRSAVERWDYVLRALTAEQLAELGKELNSLAAKWRKLSDEQEKQGVADACKVYLVMAALPWPVDFQDWKAEQQG